MSKKELHTHISTNACAEVQHTTAKKEIKEVTNFKHWKDALITFDNDRTANHATCQKEFAVYQAQQGFARGKQTTSVMTPGTGSGAAAMCPALNNSRAPTS